MSVLKSLLLGLRNGDIMKVDPDDADKRELIASLEHEINCIELDEESNKLFVLCKNSILYQIDMKGKEKIMQMYVNIGSYKSSIAFCNTKKYRYMFFHEAKFGQNSLYQLVISQKNGNENLAIANDQTNLD